MEEDLVEEYSERIQTLKDLISKAKTTLELREAERDKLKEEYANLNKDCKDKFGIALKELSREITNKQNLVSEKLEEAENKYNELTVEDNDSE
jgi:ribosome-binding protein aMBF1 (putative translation factor)